MVLYVGYILDLTLPSYPCLTMFMLGKTFPLIGPFLFMYVSEYVFVSMWMSVCVNVWVCGCGCVWVSVRCVKKKVDDDFIVNGFLETLIF